LASTLTREQIGKEASMGVPAEKPLTLPQLAEVAEVEYRTLHTWVKRGLLQPSFRVSTGAGTPNLFSFQDALVARILGDLRRSGAGLDVLERTARGLRNQTELRGDEVLLINGEVSLLSGGESLEAALSEAQPSLVYSVGWASEALAEALRD
jgi:DNA-binding transcriptional MerR regulator